MAKMIIDSGGRLSLPHPVVRELGQKTLELSSFSPRHLLLIHRRDEGELVMAGELGELAIADLLSFFNMFRKSGVLTFYFPAGVKELSFLQGEIIAASSSLPEEQLGEILCVLGKLDRSALHLARNLAGGVPPTGQLLVDKGLVGAKDLWQVVRYRAETIIYSLFALSGGSFFFVARTPEVDEQVRLSMSTQNLIMEGLRRFDERALFMRRIGSDRHLPVLTGKTLAGLPPVAERMLELIAQGRYPVRELLRKAGGGEFEGLRLLHQLLEKGLVAMEEAPAPPLEGELGDLLNIFNGALTAISRRVLGRHPGFLDEVRAFMRDVPQPFSFVFRDVGLCDDGSVDGGRILANLAGLEEGDKERLLAEALSELIYMACGVARRELPEVESGDLIQRVREVTQRVKSFIGRKG